MIATLYNVALLEWSENLISKKWVCLKDLRNYGVADKTTNHRLYKLRKQGYISVECVTYPRWMKRHYYKMTVKGKKKIGMRLTLWESLFCM